MIGLLGILGVMREIHGGICFAESDILMVFCSLILPNSKQSCHKAMMKWAGAKLLGGMGGRQIYGCHCIFWANLEIFFRSHFYCYFLP